MKTKWFYDEFIVIIIVRLTNDSKVKINLMSLRWRFVSGARVRR